MASTFHTFTSSPADWTDAGNWTDGVPVPGDAAFIGESAAVLTHDLLLSQNNVHTANVILDGNVMTLATSALVGEEVSAVFDKVIVLDRLSFMGTSQINSSLNTSDFKDLTIGSPMISNNGTIGSLSGDLVGGGKVHINPDTDDGSSGSLVNNGDLIAANGGSLQMINMTVSGDGKITMANGGKMEFINVTEFQSIDLGGAAATELSFDPNQNALNGALTGFDLSDVIDLEDWTGTFLVPPTSTVNPFLHLMAAVQLAHRCNSR
jgi:hypothetical protein